MRAAGREVILEGSGNGQLDTVKNAICKAYGIQIADLTYSEHDLDRVAESRGIAYFGLTDEKGTTTWGAGVDTDTMTASIKAFICAVNRMKEIKDRVDGVKLISQPDEISEFRAGAGAH